MIEYNVNKEKGAVVAYFKDGEKSSVKYWSECIFRKLQKIAQAKLNFLFDRQLCEIAIKAVDESIDHAGNLYGKAKIYGNDVFDEKKGKEIARNKLLIKYYNAESYAIRTFMDGYNNILMDKFNNAARVITKYEERIAAYKKKISEIGDAE